VADRTVSAFLPMFQSYYYLSSSVPLFQIAERVWRFTQAVAPVDDRCYLSACMRSRMMVRSSLFRLVISMTNFWLTSRDNTSPLIARLSILR
jgi:hypothetical protein